MDKDKIEMLIRENGYSMKSFAEALGMNRITLWRKLSGKIKFTIDEVRTICDLLHIDNPKDYFFTNKVAC